MKVALCAIARFENRYVKEWVDYHLNKGFAHIYLYDNNREDEERLSEVINTNSVEYKDVVTIVPYHNVIVCPQLKAYNDCYQKTDCDWIAFFDLDEFFTFNAQCQFRTINDLVSSRSNFDAILLNWMGFGDNGHCYYADKPVVERFVTPLPINFSVCNMFGRQPFNGHVKSIVRTRMNIKMCSPHIASGRLNCCNAKGEPTNNVPYQPTISHDVAYLRHFVTKSISEYIQTKGRRPAADSAFSHYSISSFFWYNKPTFRKWLIYKKYCKKYNVADERTLFWWIKCWVKMWIITPLFVK